MLLIAIFGFEQVDKVLLRGLLKDLVVNARVLDFSLTNEVTLGTMFDSAKLVLSVSKKELPLTLFFLAPCVLMQMGGEV